MVENKVLRFLKYQLGWVYLRNFLLYRERERKRDMYSIFNIGLIIYEILNFL